MSRSSFLLLCITRALVEAVPLAVAAALLAKLFGRAPAPAAIWIDSAAVVLFWSLLGPLVPSTRVRAVLASVTAVLSALVAASAVGLSDPAAGPAAFAGALYGGLLVWRGVGIAGSAASWRAAAVAGLAAAVGLALGAIALSSRAELAWVALLAGAAEALTLTAARGAEETFASPAAGDPDRRTGPTAALAVGAGALLIVAAFPDLGPAAAGLGRAIEPYARALVLIIVTPFVYLADWLVRLLLPVLRAVHIAFPTLLPGLGAADEEELARQLSLEAQVFLERFVIVVALLIVSALVARAVLGRILVARASTSVEREAIAGARLSDVVRGLFAKRAPKRAARPRGEDPHARIRRAYWDLLALAEGAGAGWRAPSQTPREHLAMLEGSAWRPAGDLVSRFEESRYADRASAEAAERAERALRAVERALTRSA
jgi:hypothetical protein